MRETATLITSDVSPAMLFSATSPLPFATTAAEAAMIAEGNEVTCGRSNGNGLACHVPGDEVSPGDIGPLLSAMKARFPDRAKRREPVRDAPINNTDTRMPPFGKHQALSEAETDAVVDCLYTL